MSTFPQPTSGQRLLQERKQHSWSQQMLADKLGTTVLAINRWEHDKTQPQPYYREKLCAIFGKSHSELFGTPAEEERASIWNIPHLRNLYFTGREDILTRLHDAFTTTKKAIAITQPHAISGLGGIGKTQTAVEYAYRYSHEYNVILWARADSRETLVSELVSFALVLDLPTKHETDQKRVLADVMRWLQNNKGWLLIYDNADDIEKISEFLPTRGAGHTLLTTRSQATGKNIKGIEIEKMAREEGALLLLRRAKIIPEEATLEQASATERQDAEIICELMDGLPLALDQAAAYIEENECSLSDYLTLYQTRRTILLKRRGTFGKRDYPKSVATTWSLSFEQVQRDNPAAADLLRLCAFLHPDAIPTDIITIGAAELGSLLQSVAEDPIELDTAMGTLRKYSLLKRNPETKTLTIHRLVQTVIKDDMERQRQREWAERTVKAVNRALPEVQFETWSKHDRYQAHALACATLIEEWDIASLEAARLLNQLGFYLQERGQYVQAEPFTRQALMLREQLLGSVHLDVAQSLDNLAWLYHEQGRYAEAAPIAQEALTLREQILGPMHLDVAQSLRTLAEIYHDNDKDDLDHLAEPLYLRALSIREQLQGPEHPDVAQILKHLGSLNRDHDKYAEAEPLYLRALSIYEKTLPSEHPDIASCLISMGAFYTQQDKYAQAEPLIQQALSIREKTLGPEHSEVAICLRVLAGLYRRQHKYTQAEPLYQRALRILEQRLAPEHREIALTLAGYATFLRQAGRDSEALPLEERVKAIHAK